MQVIASTRPNRPILTNADIIRVNGAYIFNEELETMRFKYKDKPLFVDIPNRREKVNISNISPDSVLRLFRRFYDGEQKSIIAFSKVEKEEDLLIGNYFLTCAKIESLAGCLNIRTIALSCDIICIDRADLVSELKDVKLYLSMEDEIIKRTKEVNKKVFIASDILPSLIQGKAPSLPEMIQLKYYRDKGVDGIILAEETAVGFYPYHAIDTIHSINKRKMEVNCE